MELLRLEIDSINNQEKKQSVILEKKDKLLILNDKNKIGQIANNLLRIKEEIKVIYKGKEVNQFYKKEIEEIKSKITILNNNENIFINKTKKILPQLIKEIKDSSNLKKNIYNSFVTHQKEKVKEVKINKQEIINNLCKEKILTINEGIKEYKKLLKEEKNRLVINKLEARNEYIAEKARLQVKLKTNNIKQETKCSSSQAKEEIKKVAKEIKINQIDLLNKTYNSCLEEEKNLINLLFAFCGKKEILIINKNNYDDNELKIINKLINEKEMILIYITFDKNIENKYFNKELNL